MMVRGGMCTILSKPRNDCDGRNLSVSPTAIYPCMERRARRWGKIVVCSIYWEDSSFFRGISGRDPDLTEMC